MKDIVVLGGGFGGLWSALGAARKLEQLGLSAEDAQITLIERNDYHSIRVRNYEEDLDSYIVELDKVLKPAGVNRLRGEVVDVDFSAQLVHVQTADGLRKVPYDKLVYALGSKLFRPEIPGLEDFSFDVDTYQAAKKLKKHLADLALAEARPGSDTVLVIGAGLTGIETAAEMPARLREFWKKRDQKNRRVILADVAPVIGSDMGQEAQAVIAEALQALNVEMFPGIKVTSVDVRGVTLADGSRLEAATVIWCAGMRTNALSKIFPVNKDRFGRVEVDEFMRIKGMNNIYAVGDAASALLDETHTSVMSCQHGRPMGRFAGHNVVAELFDQPLLPLKIDWYTTILDLGEWGAVYTTGWDRKVVSIKDEAKLTKRTINGQRIYPPQSGDREEILSAAAPVIQAPPKIYRH